MKFSMSEAWRDATAMLASNREVLLVIAGIFFFLPSLAMALTMPDMQSAMMTDPENGLDVVMSLYAEWWWVLVLVMLVQIVGYLALLALLRDDARPTVGQAIQAGLVALLPAIGTAVLFIIVMAVLGGGLIAAGAASGSVAVAFVAGLIASVGLVYVYVKFSLAGPVIAIDKVYNPIAVLARSWRLTKGNSFRLFLFYLLLVIVYFVIAIIVGVVAGALTLAAGTSTGLLVNGILSGLVGAVASVVFVAVVAAIHRQLSGPSPAAVSQTFE